MNQSNTTTPSYDRRILSTKDKKVEDYVLGCSPGCALKAEQVIENLKGSYPGIIPGSLKFRDDSWTNNENTAIFTARFKDGGSLLGSVTIKAVVEATKVTAFSDIRILNVKGQPVPLASKTSGPQSVVARLLGRGSPGARL
jgi:hypothetical protein